MALESLFFWVTNIGLPVGGILVNFLGRLPRQLPLSYGSDLALAIAFVDLTLLATINTTREFFEEHPASAEVSSALAFGVVASFAIWLALIGFLEVKANAKRKQAWFRMSVGWLLVGGLFAAHMIFVFNPSMIPGMPQ